MAPLDTADAGISHDNLVPGVLVEVRDEEWLVTSVNAVEEPAGTAYEVRARGVSDYVRDQMATFFTSLEPVEVIDPTDVTPVADTSGGYRHSRIWLESTLRNTPVPLYQPELSVADEMLLDPLDYQREAVRKALSPENLRPRLLLADAVGLGKTLEIGMILAELVRRGRGERILVVTPRHVLEQFQQELWTRFALPLVRLDSQGIQQVRQRLPASRNPFSYFPRIIVSMDTLKSPKYRAQLEKVTWDAVVIDEIHNATNTGTQNNQLARTLAPTTEALILASATPHNGDPDSFKEILRLLDPTAVRPDGEIDAEAAERLIIRRHRNSPEVKQVVGADWAERAEPRNILVAASDEENAVLTELQETWLTNPKPPCTDRLFPWTLFKAFLSSPVALAETLEGRLKRLGGSIGDAAPAAPGTERAALARLAALNDKVTAQNSNKFATLVSYLQEIGVGPRKDTRVVVFSERVATLHWLRENLKKHLKFKDDNVAVMHGGLDDQTQMAIIDDFKREDSKIRVLVTGDVASEGVNLHQQCHHMVHFDIPWSLIRIQQRNGRIDRYGQRHQPQIATLLLDPKDPDLKSDVTVLTKLVDREHAANEMIGDASSLMGRYSEAKEEDAIRDVLRGARDFEEVVKTPEEAVANQGDIIEALLAGLPVGGAAPAPEPPTAGHTSLYDRQITYLADALSEAFGNPAASPADGGVAFTEHANATADLVPTRDLARRLDFLPRDYLRTRHVKDKMALATTEASGKKSLEQARAGTSGSTWPKAHFLGPLHPVLAWAQERALAASGRREIPVVTGTGEKSVLLLMGTVTDAHGRVISRSFLTAEESLFGVNVTAIPDPVAFARSQGLGGGVANAGTTAVPEGAAEFVREACRAAAGPMTAMRAAAEADAGRRIESFRDRIEKWLAEDAERTAARSAVSKARVDYLSRELTRVDRLFPKDALIRPVILFVPENREG